MSTLQDSQGFIWLATEDGLVRYDGHELVRYAYSRNVVSGLPGNFIYQIAEDSHQNLWLAVKDAGVARWNRATDNFTVFRHDPANDQTLGSDATRAVLVDKSGHVWVGTSGAGLDIIDQRTGLVEHMRHDPQQPNTLGDDQILTLTMDRTGTLWVGTAAGLDQWRPADHSFVHYRANAGKSGSLTGTRVSQVLTDESQHTWVGTLDGGLDMLDSTGSVVAAYRHDAAVPSSLSSDEVRALLQDHAGRLWVGTRDGLDLFDATTGGFRHYRHEESDGGSLRDSYIMSLYQDDADLLWIGTRQGGVSRWNPHSWELGGHRPAWLVGKLVTSFADAQAGRVWVGSLGGGLVRFDDRSGEAQDIDKIVGKPNVLGDRRVMSLLTDHNGTLWVGMMTTGIKKFSKDGELTSLTVKPGSPQGLSAAGIMSLYEARNGNVWIGTFGGGVNVIEAATGIVRQLPYLANSAGATSSDNITAIAEDEKGYLWFGTGGGGLDIARPDGTVIKVFKNDPNVPTSLPSNTIYGITVDKKQQIWIATDKGGIARVIGSPDRPDEIQFEIKSREDGLSSDTIYSVIPDDSGKLWMSGNAGLLRLDPADDRIKSFHREQGLQGEEFDFNASLKLPDGRLCFGGPGGFNLFDPAMLKDIGHAPRVVLTRIEVLGAPFHSDKPFWLLDRVALDSNASIVSLDFGALDFTSPKRNRLAYRIAGLSDRWIDLGTQHRITLTDPDSGDHLLEVRAANADSVWSDPPLTLVVHRDPPAWRSGGAYALYAMIALLFIAYRVRLTRRRLARIVRAKESLESQVAVRTRELIESNRQLEDASRAKSNFLARISHELRTPMNGVVGSTELLARTTQSPKQKRLTDTIQFSATVLLQIVNDLLDLSKIQAGKIQLENLPLDLTQILEQSAMLFVAAAEARGIELIVCPPEVSIPLQGDALRIRQILMNLIGNAVKFTLKGEVAIKADVSRGSSDTAVLELTVTDTGIGMDVDTIGRIFEPFTQADESTTRRFGGTGLGLAICRELATRMGGSIEAESSPGVGSTFRVALTLLSPGAPSDAQRPSPGAAQTRILSRRRSLHQALGRQVRRIGHTVAADEEAGLQWAATSATIVDLGTYESYVLKRATGEDRSNTPLVIVATAAELDRLRQQCDPGAMGIVHKPVQQECLEKALLAALSGTNPEPAELMDIAQLEPILGHVLIVEDEPVNAQVAQAYVHELGCTSTWVTNGPDALARCRGERFDLVLMDLSMPGMDGFATTRLIRKHEVDQGRLPIIALTAHDGSRYREECRAAGMDDVLCKPYTLAQCAEVLRAWLKPSRSSKRPTAAAESCASTASINSKLATVDAQSVAGLRTLKGAGSEQLYAKLVRIFHGSSSDALQQLETNLACADYIAASAVCHKLAAAAANVGALPFAREVRRLEQACAFKDEDSAQHIAAQLKAILPALWAELAKEQIQEIA